MLHNETKLMLLGLEKVLLDDPHYEDSVLDNDQYQRYIADYIEPLAFVEHERWNAFHYLRDWQPADNRKETKEELAKLKLHRDLVPWHELSDKSKEYDRESVRRLREYYEAQGYGLVNSLED